MTIGYVPLLSQHIIIPLVRQHMDSVLSACRPEVLHTIVITDGGRWYHSIIRNTIERFGEAARNTLSFMSVKSYRNNLPTEFEPTAEFSGGEHERMLASISEDDDRMHRVLVLDDIVDSGRTMNCVFDALTKQGITPFEIIYSAMCYRAPCPTTSPAQSPNTIMIPKQFTSTVREFDHPFFSPIRVLSDRYLVGCGLDDDGQNRDLPFIGYLM